jgi:uncharacterized membrane protein YGL010W
VKTAVEQLIQYASYHRDSRNVMSHFIGVPLIVFAVIVLLSRPNLAAFGVAFGGILPLSPAFVLTQITALYYLRLDVRLGIAMTIFLEICLWLAALIAAGSTQFWLLCGVGIFVIGWVIQFIGHYYEGKKPAFVDDVVGLIIGPIFVAAEFSFLMGWRKELQATIESRVGPLYKRVF